ncbi:MAG: MBL fold metallo-hydrolase [Candidatus Tyrphobacter sp.]
MSSILFLGSGGARFVVARQLRASGGMWMRFGQTQLHVDPGPGALVRALTHVPPCNPRELDGILLSHKHLDHSGDVNVMIEAMTAGGHRKRGAVLAPRDALEGEPVVLPYAQEFVERVVALDADAGPYRVGAVEVFTSIAHVHAAQTYGFHFAYEGLRVAYLPCGRFFEGLAEDYARRRPDILVINVLRFRDGMDVDHLAWDDAQRIVETVQPKVVVFAHFGTKMLERDPAVLAQEVEDRLGLRAIAADDGMIVDLEVETEAATL